MPVIVFNKRTGKYLRRHSGSFRYTWRMLQYKKGYKEEIIKRFGNCPSWKRDDEENARIREERGTKIAAFLKDTLCDAEPGDARVYATKRSALTSVGRRTTWVATENRDKSEKVYEPLDHLEIHEIKEVSVCVMRPDGSSNCDDEEAV